MGQTTLTLPIMTSVAGSASIPKSGFADTFAAFTDVFVPTIAKGVIIRRPRALAIPDHLDLDRRAIRRMQRLRNKYGQGPLQLRFPGRSIALILNPRDVHRVLSQSPEPFATSTPEKRSVLAHFEPKNVLISHGPDRATGACGWLNPPDSRRAASCRPRSTTLSFVSN